MSRNSRFRALAIAGVALGMCACAETSVTGWGYSSWVHRGGPAEMGDFDRQREACLQQTGITDAASVVPGSEEEDRFVRCMNAANWCTIVYHCQKPGE